MNRPAPWRSIMATVVDRQPFRVGGATIDPASRDASWAGGKERLQPQTLKVLTVLVGQRGEVVTREELVQLCWDGRAVSDDVINRAVLLLRHLAERAGGFQIETVPRTGYRLIENGGSAGASWRSSKRKAIAGAGLAFVLLAGISAWALSERPSASQGRPPAPSVSVVPFTAEGGDSLTRQVAESAPASLTRMLSQSGFAIVRDDPAAARDNSKTDYIFSGSVRRTGNVVDASVQLVSKRDGRIAFSHDFSAPIDRAGDLADRIGATAAAELAWTGAEMVLDPREHLDPQVANELMTSINLTNEEGQSIRAYQMARHAAAMAPDAAIAQLTLAVQTGFSISAIPREERPEAIAVARRSAARARALAPEFGDVYLTRCLLRSPVRLSECEADGRHGLEVDPRSSFVPGFLSDILYAAGREDESLELASQAWANDPYKSAKLARMVQMLELTGDRAGADRYFKEAVRLWPDTYRPRAGRLLGLAVRGDYDAMEAFVDPAIDAEKVDKVRLSALNSARRKRDLAAAEQACAGNSLRYLNKVVCMTVLADLGDNDGSFAIASDFFPVLGATKSVNEDAFWLDHPDGYDTALLTGPAARAMRTDPRFLNLADRLGLLAYWRSHPLPDFCVKAHEPVCSRIRGNFS